MSNVIARVQNLLVDAGFADSTIALAAAKSADFEILEMLRESFGPEIFIAKQSTAMRSAYEYAASANQVEVMRWLKDQQILPPLAQYAEYDYYMKEHHVRYNEHRVQCRVAFIAAAEGSFDALEYIADEIPELRELPLQAVDTHLAMPSMRTAGSVERYPVVNGDRDSERVSYSGLLVICALAARSKGMDASPIVERLQRHLDSGGLTLWRDLNIALRFMPGDLATMLLEAGAKINLTDLADRIDYFHQPTVALAVISDHLERSGKRYVDVCERMWISEPNNDQVPVDSFDQLLQTKNGFLPIIHKFVDAARKVETNVRMEYRVAPENVGGLAGEVVRFMGNVDQRFVGPSMLSVALRNYHYDMAEVLLERGVDPNEYQPAYINDFSSGNKLPVHICESPEILRMLVHYGADVNLPLRGEAEKNLLYQICTKKFDPHFTPAMFAAFAECGGDFGRKFDGKTAAALAKKSGPEVHQHFMAAKTSVVIAKNMDCQQDEAASKPSRSPKMSNAL